MVLEVVINNIIQLKKNKLSNASKLQFTRMKDGPVIETTLAENLLLKKFLTFALADVQFQLDMTVKSGLSKKKLEESAFAGGFIIEYLNILLEEIQRGIDSVKDEQSKNDKSG